MQIINNRFKIDKFIDQDIFGSKYVAIDLVQNEHKLFLNIVNNDDLSKPFIDFCIDNFLEISSRKNSALFTVLNFGVIDSIDDKSATETMYYYTTEYVETNLIIDLKQPLSKEELLSVYVQLARAIDYLHFCGDSYKYIHSDTVTLFRENGEVKVKLKDLISLKKEDLFSKYGRKFYDIEFLEESNQSVKNLHRIDIFSLGTYLYYLLTLDCFNREDLLNLINKYDDDVEKKWMSSFFRVINKMVRPYENTEYSGIHEVNKDIKDIFELDYIIEDKTQVDRLNFNIPLVGRENELKNIFNAIEQDDNKLLLIRATKGMGRKRLISEVFYRMKLKKYNIFSISCDLQDSGFRPTIASLLRQVIKLSDRSIIMKYAKEIVKIIPDMIHSYNTTPSQELPEDREMLRLFDRISNFIVDTLDQKPTIIVIDNFNIANQAVVEFIDYLQKLSSVKNSTITILLGVTETEQNGEKSEHYVNKWLYDEDVVEVKLNRLSVQEIAKMFSYISGWYKEPLKLATRIMEKTEGVPAYIGEAIREMYDRGSLRIDYADKGVGFAWHLDTEDYETIVKLDNIEDTVKSQLLKFSKETKKILEVISTFKGSISSETINKLLNCNKDNSAILSKLVQLGILHEQLEDRGFSYSFRSSSVKEFVYMNVEENKRLLMHKMACTVLEKLFEVEDVKNKEELIYHLDLSGQKSRAIDYYVEAGDSMLKLNIYSQALLFYTKAVELFGDGEDARRSEVLIKIGDIKKNQGDNEGALQIFADLIKESTLQKNACVEIDLVNRISNIMMSRNELKKAEKKLLVTMKKAQRIKCYDGLLEGAFLLGRIYMDSREIEKMDEVTDKYLTLAKKLKNSEYTGKLLSQKGIVEFYRGNFELSLNMFKKSIEEFEDARMTKETSRPYNNIAVIFFEHMRDKEKAKKYFSKALEISTQFNIIDIMVVAWVNLAEISIEEDDYHKAIDFLNKSVELAVEYGEERLKFNANLNLIKCYTRLHDFNSASNYLSRVQEDLDFNKEVVQNLGSYYKGRLEFMENLGEFDEVVSIAEEALTKIPKMDKKVKVGIEVHKFLAEIALSNKVDESKLHDLMERMGEVSSFIYHRHMLLKTAEHYILNCNNEKAEMLLSEDKKLVEIFNSKYLEFYRRYVRGLIVDTIESFEQLLFELLPTHLEQLKWKTYSKIGSKQIEKKNYFAAVHSFLRALEIIGLIANRIPKKYRDSYLLCDNKYLVIKKLQLLYKVVILQQKESIFKEALNLKEVPKKYIEEDKFDVARYRELFQKDEFYKLALENYKKTFPSDIDSIEDLVKSLTCDIKTNLKVILDFLGTITLATRAAVISASYSKMEIMAYIGDCMDLRNIDYLFNKLVNSTENMILEDKFITSRSQGRGSEFVGDKASAVMCIPIIDGNILESKVGLEQRKWKNMATNKIEGYIYLETDRIFSNFTLDAANKCKELIPLICLMLRNHSLSFDSSMDKMTGMYNRTYFEKVMNEKVEEAKKLNLSFSIIICDIDHFKNVNDKYGHQRGDLILTNTGRIIKESVRETDVVGRYGGEEFIILLTETKKKDAFYVAENIRLKFNNAMLLGNDGTLTISCGVATYPDDAIHKDAVIEKADIALYDAKESGRNATTVWEEGMEIVQNRADKLAGIVTGNSIQDQRNILALIEILETMLAEKSLAEKVFIVIGRLIEISEAEEGIVFFIEGSKIREKIMRKRFVNQFVEDVSYNENLINKTIQTMKGDFLIDWENISHIDILTGTPNWKSVIISPIIVGGELKGIVQLSVAAREKEFDFNSFNLVKLMCNIMGAHI